MRATTVVLTCTMTVAAATSGNVAGGQALAPVPLTLYSAHVWLDGTSNVHAFTASTPTVTIRSMELAGTPSGDLLGYILQPGNLKGLEVSIPTRGLTSPKEGIDENMHKALRATEHPHIRFRLDTFERAGSGYRATGRLTVAGVERAVVLGLQIERKGSTLAVTGGTALLMTDYGISPPRARLGMLKTNPLVRIRIELILGGRATQKDTAPGRG
jgi:hypothetical protein